jgi:hypothetical protein
MTLSNEKTLSGIQSYYGMNVVEINGIYHTGIDGNQPTSHWHLKTFWITAVPLTVGTIILPLIIGPIFRVVGHFTLKYHTYWRILVAAAIISTVVVTWFVCDHGRCYGVGWLLQVADLFICLCYTIRSIYRAAVGKQRKRQWVTLWVVFFFILAGCLFGWVAK